MSNMISQVVLFGVIAVGIIVTLMALFGESYDPMLYASYALIGLTVLLALGSSGVMLILRPATILSSGITTVALLVVVGISYALATDVMPPSAAMLDASPAESRWSGAELICSYILGVLAMLSVVGSGVMKMIR